MKKGSCTIIRKEAKFYTIEMLECDCRAFFSVYSSVWVRHSLKTRGKFADVGKSVSTEECTVTSEDLVQYCPEVNRKHSSWKRYLGYLGDTACCGIMNSFLGEG